MIKCDLCGKNLGGYEIDDLILCQKCYEHFLKTKRNFNKFINLQKQVVY